MHKRVRSANSLMIVCWIAWSVEYSMDAGGMSDLCIVRRSIPLDSPVASSKRMMREWASTNARAKLTSERYETLVR